MRRSGVRFGALIVILLLLALAAFAGTAQTASAQPTKVLVVVMDQMHPEYAQQYNMTNVLWLEQHGAWFPNAYVGDMASETVVSHNVMVSGLFPKHMGWSDEALRDTNNVLGGGANGIYITGDLSYAQFQALIAAGDYPKLGTYLHAKYPGSFVACVGEKNYQVRSMTAGSADLGVFLGSAKSSTNGGDPALLSLLGGSYRGPSIVGTATAPYITADPTNRFYVNSDLAYNDYGTNTMSPAWIYPEDGDRMIPGNITGHLGGDTWVADATIKIMQNQPNWSGLFVNFGAIDKVGHMWGGGQVDTLKNYQWDPNSIYNMVHEPFIAKNADTQLGRLIGELKATGQYDNTLIVVLADHGSTAATKNFFGTNAQGAGDYNWYHGDSLTDGNYYNDPLHPVAPALQALTDLPNVTFTYASTAIEAWLTDFSMTQKQAAAAVMQARPGVIATYVKNDAGTAYTRTSVNTSSLSKSSLAWFNKHAQELVDTMAWSGSADVVGLLQDRTTYGAFGDHGGAQMDVQSIPMVFYNPSLKTVKYTAATRLVDVMPTIMRTMGIAETKAMDGKAYSLQTK